MSYAIKTALVAVPAIFTLLAGLAFVVLCFLLVVELVRLMPYAKQALQIYIARHTDEETDSPDTDSHGANPDDSPSK